MASAGLELSTAAALCNDSGCLVSRRCLKQYVVSRKHAEKPIKTVGNNDQLGSSCSILFQSRKRCGCALFICCGQIFIIHEINSAFSWLINYVSTRQGDNLGRVPWNVSDSPYIFQNYTIQISENYTILGTKKNME